MCSYRAASWQSAVDTLLLMLFNHLFAKVVNQDSAYKHVRTVFGQGAKIFSSCMRLLTLAARTWRIHQDDKTS